MVRKRTAAATEAADGDRVARVLRARTRAGVSV
jgi:hypothetical protein